MELKPLKKEGLAMFANNRIYKTILLVLVTVPHMWGTVPDSYVKDAQKCRDFYSKASSFSFDVDVYTFENATDTKGTSQGKATMAKMGALYFSRFMDDEIMVTASEMVIIDHARKTIVYTSLSNASKPKAPFEMNLKSALGRDSVVYIGETGNMVKYVAHAKNDEIKKTEIFFDKNQGYLSKLVYYYHNSNKYVDMGGYKTELCYSNVKINQVDKNIFSINKYVKKSGSKWITADAYKGYSIINSNNE